MSVYTYVYVLYIHMYANDWQNCFKVHDARGSNVGPAFVLLQALKESFIQRPMGKLEQSRGADGGTPSARFEQPGVRTRFLKPRRSLDVAT